MTSWSRLRDSHIHLETGKRSRRLQQQPAQTPLLADLDAASPLGHMASVISECLCEARAGGAEWADIRFNPLSWRKRGVPPERQLNLLECLAAAAKEKLQAGFAVYVTLKQESSESEWQDALAFALAGQQSVVKGIDVSRSYDVGEPGEAPATSDLRNLLNTCKQAHDGGLAVAVHCGWFDSRQDLIYALDMLGASRIGHGLPAGTDRGLLRRIADAKVTMEVCPTAFTRRTNRDFASHPLPVWLEEGVRFCVGTDHPVAFGTVISREHALIGKAFPLALPTCGNHP